MPNLVAWDGLWTAGDGRYLKVGLCGIDPRLCNSEESRFKVFSMRTRGELFDCSSMLVGLADISSESSVSII